MLGLGFKFRLPGLSTCLHSWSQGMIYKYPSSTENSDSKTTGSESCWEPEGKSHLAPWELSSVLKPSSPGHLYLLIVCVCGGGGGGEPPCITLRARSPGDNSVGSVLSLHLYECSWRWPGLSSRWAAYPFHTPRHLASLKLLKLFPLTTPSYPRNSYTILGI